MLYFDRISGGLSIEILFKNREQMIELGFKRDFKQPVTQYSTHRKTQLLTYQQDKQRFNKNHEVNDRIARQQQRDKKDHFYQARLQKRLQRDDKRWQQQSLREKQQQKKLSHKHSVLTQNCRNINGLGYNPISHQYQQSNRGKKLQIHDQGKQVNRYVRSKNLVEKSIPAFNIITGEPTTKIKQNVPEKFRDRVEEKYQAKIERQKIKYQPKKDKYDYLDD